METYFRNNNRIFYFNSLEKKTALEFGETLFHLIKDNMAYDKTIVFLCIGTDRATGDSLGPIIGYKLAKYKHHQCVVYGTLENPVHAQNLENTIRMINEEHDNKIVIAIDASLGRSSRIGYITLGEGSLKPGAGVNKNLPPVGDIFITGIVNISGLLDNMLLQTTRLNIVMSMADQICIGINYFMYQLHLSLQKGKKSPRSKTHAY